MAKVVCITQARAAKNEGSPAMSSGYIKLYRGIQDVPFKRDPDRFALWVHMLLEASHKEYQTILGGNTLTIQPGQFVSAIRELSEGTGVSFQRVRTSLQYFEREGMIKRDTSNRSGTIFTVVKYADYQGKKGDFSNTPATHQINTQDNTPKASNHAALSDTATHQPTHHQHTSSTPIQEYNNTSPNGEECESGDSTRSESQGKTSRYPACPHRELLAIWAEVIPETIQHNPNEWKSGRAGYRNLAARWKAGFTTMKRDQSGPLYHDTESGLAWWRSFFEYLRKSDFLMNRCRPFSLEWIVKQANYLKAKEGNYHDAH